MNTPLKHDAQIAIGNNYRFTIADNQTLAQILRESFGGTSVEQYLQYLQEGREFIGSMVVAALKRYSGRLQERLLIAEYHNLVPSTIRNSMATLISGTSIAPTLKAKYFALGTGSTAPANGDTQLQTETLRALFSQQQATLNVAYLDVFFGTSQVAGNSYLEAGIFIDGSASVNTGYLLSHVAINQTLGSNQTMTVNSTITLS